MFDVVTWGARKDFLPSLVQASKVPPPLAFLLLQHADT